MKKILILFLCIFFFHSIKAQTKNQKEPLIGIIGNLTSMRQAQDDISFYTWSLYLEVDMPGGWDIYQDSTEIKINFTELEKGCGRINNKKLEFNKNYFHTEKDIKEFQGNIKKGDKIKILVKKSSLEEFFKGQKCMIYMNSIMKIK